MAPGRKVDCRKPLRPAAARSPILFGFDYFRGRAGTLINIGFTPALRMSQRYHQAAPGSEVPSPLAVNMAFRNPDISCANLPVWKVAMPRWLRLYGHLVSCV